MADAKSNGALDFSIKFYSSGPERILEPSKPIA